MFKESDIVFSAKHIVKQFPASHGRTLTACNDINLNVYKGKTLGIVGESGCGKSTFVRMVISLDKPTSGEILYHGKKPCWPFQKGNMVKSPEHADGFPGSAGIL